MSKISELGKNYINLPNMLEIYEEELTEAEDKIKIKGRKLEISISENSAWLHFYDQRRVELNALVKHFKAEEDRIRSTLFRSYTENYSKSLGERQVNKYIDSEKDYIFIHALLIEVEEMYELYQVVVNVFITRNYALSNITKIRVASLENVEI